MTLCTSLIHVGDLVVREEVRADEGAVASVVGAAFGSDLEVRLVDAIRRGAGYIPQLSLVAVVDRVIVGHVMISHARLVGGWDECRVATLSPLAVAPSWQRRGVGSALVGAVTSRADAMGEPLVVLEGNPAFYGRFGFEPAGAVGITIDLPEWAPPEAAQVLRLRRYTPEIRGHLVFESLARAMG